MSIPTQHFKEHFSFLDLSTINTKEVPREAGEEWLANEIRKRVGEVALSKFSDVQNEVRCSFESGQGEYKRLRNKKVFTNEEKAQIEDEVENALTDHDLFILTHPIIFAHDGDAIQFSDKAQSQGLKVSPFLSKHEDSALNSLRGMDLDKEKNRIEDYSDASILEAEVTEVKKKINQREALLQEEGTASFTGSKANRLHWLKKAGLDEQLKKLENFRNPENREGSLREIEAKIDQRDELQTKKDKVMEKQRRLSEILSQLPFLEPTYRYAIAQLKEANFFYPGVRIPSFMEICYTFFNIERSKYQPENYRPPKRLDEIMPKVIERLQNNPEMIRTIMMWGVMGHYPAITQHDKNAFLITSTAKDYRAIHGRDCVYDQAAEEYADGKQNGNAVNRAKFMSSPNSKLDLIHPLVYLRGQSYRNQQDREEQIQRELDYIRAIYNGLTLKLLEDFDEEPGLWAEGAYDVRGSSWIDSPKEVGEETQYSDAGTAVAGLRDEVVVGVARRYAHFHDPFWGWRASLRVSWA